MDFGITTISSKGQIVIPKDMRRSFKQGDKLLLIREGDSFMLKALDTKKTKKEFEFARRTEKAWREYEKGKYAKMDMGEFLEAAKKW